MHRNMATSMRWLRKTEMECKIKQRSLNHARQLSELTILQPVMASEMYSPIHSPEMAGIF